MLTQKLIQIFWTNNWLILFFYFIFFLEIFPIFYTSHFQMSIKCSLEAHVCPSQMRNKKNNRREEKKNTNSQTNEWTVKQNIITPFSTTLHQKAYTRDSSWFKPNIWYVGRRFSCSFQYDGIQGHARMYSNSLCSVQTRIGLFVVRSNWKT